MISVTLDGMAENALVDTGASYTTIARTRALAAGVTEQMLQADHQGSVQGIARARADVAAHRFTSLQIGTESFSRPTLIVAPLPGSVDNTSYHMLLGEDYLRKHRVWISYDGYSVHVARPKP
jgi:predicted aspartyl protease